MVEVLTAEQVEGFSEEVFLGDDDLADSGFLSTVLSTGFVWFSCVQIFLAIFSGEGFSPFSGILGDAGRFWTDRG